MPKERILITVKTYPTLSRKYGELVCTAGIREDGSWVRLYPVPFRLMDYQNRYSKYDWIETSLVKSSRDRRPESYHPVDIQDIMQVGHLGTENNWAERRRLILGQSDVYNNLQEIIDGAKNNRMSLAVFKPDRIIDFKWKDDDTEWDEKKLEEMKSRADQADLFLKSDMQEMIAIMPKLPYKFYYRFSDAEGKESEMQILDWEVGQLYWNCLRRAKGNEREALVKVSEKYHNEFLKKDLHLFLGTTQQYHNWASNPWVIIGVFPIPYEQQLELI
jgi:hypothetical protein